MELLAPAGTLEVFETAVESGADAIYIGAPEANARALARRFTSAECAAMSSYAHKHGVKLYVAMNSLLKDSEVPAIIELLALFVEIGVDALIIQDLGLLYLVQRYFPTLHLHASTLMGAVNSLAIRQFAELGFDRVVVAREMQIEEIAAASSKSPVELEAFVHGAMCFSYSGLCLFSSFLGGKSGLRGRCVQPCRRNYFWEKEGKTRSGGYFFSMNDLEGLRLIEPLREAGVSSLKIEGRMRSRQYVEYVVRAYRKVLDHPGDSQAVTEAEKMLAFAMGRKTSPGYFQLQNHADLISPQHSGNIGLFVGQVADCKKGGAGIKLRDILRVGDRLRIHLERSGERISFTLSEIWAADKSVSEAKPGEYVRLAIPEAASPGDSIYKVDTRESRGKASGKAAIKPQQFSRLVRQLKQDHKINQLFKLICPPNKRNIYIHPTTQNRKSGIYGKKGHKKIENKGLPITWWLKVDDLQLLRKIPVNIKPDRIAVVLSPKTLRQFKRGAASGPAGRGLIWSLPSVILEGEVQFYHDAVVWLAGQGFGDWQISHISQLQIFRDASLELADKRRHRSNKTGGKRHIKVDKFKQFHIVGNYSLNIMNKFALQFLDTLGVHQSLISLEADREMVATLGGWKKDYKLGMTVYSFPPLFTSRAMPQYFKYDQRLVSPKGEKFVLRQNGNLTLALPAQPFSLLPMLAEVKAFGIDYAVVDLSGARVSQKELGRLWRQLTGSHRPVLLSSFNYRGKLL